MKQAKSHQTVFHPLFSHSKGSSSDRNYKQLAEILENSKQVENGALFEYMSSVNGKKNGEERVLSQKQQINYIQNIFILLEKALYVQNDVRFEQILQYYIQLVKSKQNNRFYLALVQKHLKDILQLELPRKNKKIYFFLMKMFELNPYLAYKQLQLRPDLFEGNSEESLQIYSSFIEFAASKKNISLLLKHIKMFLRKDDCEIQRLKILLNYFPSILNEEYIRNIYDKIHELFNNFKGREKELLQLIKVLVSLPWPEQKIKKSDIIMEYLELWKNKKYDEHIQKLLNEILRQLNVETSLLGSLKKFILMKIGRLGEPGEKNQIFLSIQIIIEKLGQNYCEEMISKGELMDLVEETMKYSLEEEPVMLLRIFKKLDLHDMAQSIEHKLKGKIQIILSYQMEIKKKRSQSDSLALREHYRVEDKLLALRALRIFGFDGYDVHYIIKRYILKNCQTLKNFEFKQQIIQACLYVITKDSPHVDKMQVMSEVLSIISQDLNLKIMTIEWFKNNEKSYDMKIFEVFKEPQFLSILFQDHASNNMLLKRFSIKILCLIYPLNQCQIVPFLKKTYYNIYDRLSCQKLIQIDEKKEALKLTRQIIRHRTEIIFDDASVLCRYLYDHLCDAYKYNDRSKNSLLIELFKTLIALIRKASAKVYPYVRPIVEFIIKILNLKQIQINIKNIALRALNQIVQNCEYVLLPYFHFPNMFQIISAIIKEEQKFLDQIELLRLLGNLGFINQDKFTKMANLTIDRNDVKQLNANFQKVFRETNYLKQIKGMSEIKPEKKEWKGPLLYQKQDTSHVYIDINNYKFFIIMKILKNISENSPNNIRQKSFKVLESLIFELNKEEEKMYQKNILPAVRKVQKLKIERKSIFSLVSLIIRYQDTSDNRDIVLDYLFQSIENCEDCPRQKLVELFEVVTRAYPITSFREKTAKKLIVWITKQLFQANAGEELIKKGFKIIENLAKSINNLLHLFIPEFNRVFITEKQQICLCYFEMILVLCQRTSSIEYYLLPITESVINLFRLLINKRSINLSIFIQKIINFILCLIVMYGDFFKSFISSIRQLVKQSEVNHVFFRIAEQYMKKYSTLNFLKDAYNQDEINELFRSRKFDQIKKKNVERYPLHLVVGNVFDNVIEEFTCDKNQIQEESEEWFNNLCIILIENQTSFFIKSCLPLAKEDRNFSHDLFPLAIYFFWKNLKNQQMKKLTSKIKLILESKVLSLRIKQQFIDTVYFMAQCQTPIPITNKQMYEASKQVLDQAKALFYMEMLFINDPVNQGQTLIKVYAQLGEKYSAIGLLQIVKNLHTKTKVLLYQKLKRYFDALREYDRLEDKKKLENVILQITIRKEMSDWDSVIKLCSTQASKSSSNKSKLSHLAVEASINLGKWDQVQGWLSNLSPEHQNINLWKTMLKINEKKYNQALQWIEKDRKSIYPKVCQLFNFSFERRMEGVIRLQQLCELEEAITLIKKQSQAATDKKLLNQSNLKRKKLQTLWNDRIEGSKKDLSSMQQLLMSRNLFLSKAEDINNWIDFCSLALKQNQPELTKKTLNTLKDEIKKEDNKKTFEIQTLKIECNFILGEIKDEQAVAMMEKIISQKGQNKSDKTISKLYYNCALWLSEKEYDFTVEKGNKCIEILKKATTKMKRYIKGWHLMGLMHLKMEELIKERKKNEKKSPTMQEEMIQSSFRKEPKDSHIYLALHCFINSVSCGLKNHGFFLQDCLKIMNILFNEHEVPGLIEELNKTYLDIPSDGLIQIIPQIMGRLDIVEQPKILDIMKKLLVHICSNHPQALMFPLVFLRRGEHETRRKIADDVYKEIIKKDASIVSLYAETQLIVIELCKVSLKLNEKFKILMTKHYDRSKQGADPRQIAEKYRKLCNKYLKQNSSELSISQFGFIQQYRQELSDVVEYLDIYKEHNETQLFRRAEKIIVKVLKQLQTNLKNIKKLSLEEASPKLQKYSSSKVCLPGAYKPNSENVHIASFFDELEIIDSKQRPKKLIIKGTNGKQYLFLLKGKEDLRLDERIMQLFSLINKMFHDLLERQNYCIQGYSITPLSLQTGLIQWVQDCDTIGDLIMKYRKSTTGKVFHEEQIGAEICMHSHKLPKAHKVEIYKEIQTRISGLDLRNIFWIRSSNSEEWLKSRSCYTRSLAVMSIVGYVIGLGDRHPHNIMIQRKTGKIVHIDFGDCFDVNKMRKQYPEKVPFRLTRMLVKAMQPCGIHGIFKHTCQKIIKMLRSNKESIIAIIEAFRYDPLIGWKLNGKEDEQMLEHSFENHQTEQSFLQEEKEGGQRNRINIQPKRLNLKFAQHVLNQIKKKLNGRYNDDSNKVMSHEEQVNILIKEAMSPENLVEHYAGWSIYW